MRPKFYAFFAAVILCGIMVAIANTSAAKKSPSSASTNKISSPTKTRVKSLSLVFQKYDPRIDSDAYELVTGMQSGTELTFIVSQPNQRIIGINDDHSKLLALKDNKGTNLIKASDEWAFGPTVDTQVAKNGQACLVTFNAPGTPADGAKNLYLNARVVLLCGANLKTAQKQITLRNGSSMNVGPMSLKISGVENIKSKNHNQLKLTLESSQPMDRINNVAFIGSQNKIIKSQLVGSGSMSGGASTTYQQEYLLNGNVSTATLKVSYYKDVKSITVPFNKTFGVGM